MTTGSVESPPPQTYSSPPVTIILTVVLLIFFFVGFFAIYFCRCFLENLLYSWYLRHSPSGTPVCANAGQGIDPSIIDTFPSFTYASVKDLRKDKYGLECAICLAEFQNDDVLRLLTGCCHVFHQECIDLWLESHKTCPVCRRSLDTPYQSPERPVINQTDEPPVENSISISIRQDEEECGGGEAAGSGQRAEGEKEGGRSPPAEGHIDDEEVEKFSRSHSTGHSILRTRRDEDRYTLILPEHVQAKLFRDRNWTKSCSTFGEFKSKTTAGNGGFSEVSGPTSGGDVNRV